MSFMIACTLASLLVGIPLSYLGLFVILRRVTFVGVALGQLASAGVALGVLLNWPLWVGAGLFTLLGVGSLSVELPRRRVPDEAWIAVFYLVSGAAAVILLSIVPGGEADMMGLLFGNILAFDPADLLWMTMVLGAVLVLHLVFFKEFLLVSFDAEMARVMRYRVGCWTFLFYLTLGLVVAVAVQVAGVMLVFAYLVLPPLVALLSCRKWATSVLISLAVGVVSSVLGVGASLGLDLPTGSAIIVVQFIFLILALMVRKLCSSN